MRTGLFLVAGFLLLAASLLLGRLFSANYPSATVVANPRVCRPLVRHRRRKHVDRGRESRLLCRRGAAHICAHLRSSRCCSHHSEVEAPLSPRTKVAPNRSVSISGWS
jgi:hypothetical protein